MSSRTSHPTRVGSGSLNFLDKTQPEITERFQVSSLTISVRSLVVVLGSLSLALRFTSRRAHCDLRSSPLPPLLLLLLLAAFFSVLSDKTMHSYQNDVGTRADLHALAGVRGFLCDWPLRFLEKESLELKVTSKESIAGEVMFV